MWEKTEGECEIVDIREEKDKKLISLSENIFRPTMGGQDCDLGVIEKDGEKIQVHGAKLIEGKVYLIVPINADLKLGDKVYAKVDIDRRSTLSRLHTAQHILFKALKIEVSDLSFINVFMTIKDNRPYGELKVASPIELNWEHITRAEVLANNKILEDLPVREYEVSIGELDESVRVRETLLNKVEKVRIIEVKEFDKTACSGTHVKSTKEIGFVKVLNWKKLGKSGNKYEYKIYFTISKSALEYSLAITNMVLESANRYAFQPVNVGNFINNVMDKNKQLEGAKNLLFELLYHIIEEKVLEDKTLYFYHPNLPIKESLRLLKKIRKKHRGRRLPTVILVGNINNKLNMAILLGDPKEQGLVSELQTLSFKCWGKDILQCITDNLMNPEELEKRLQEVLKDEINKLLEH